MAVYRRIAPRAGLPGLRPAACCLLSRIPAQPGVTLEHLADEIGTPTSNLGPILGQLADRHLVAIHTADAASTSPLIATERSRAAAQRLRAARGEDLAKLLQGWSPDQHRELLARLQTLARELIAEDLARLGFEETLKTPT